VGFLLEQGEESLLSEALENKKTQPKAVGLYVDSRDRRNILRSEMNPGTKGTSSIRGILEVPVGSRQSQTAVAPAALVQSPVFSMQ